MAAPDITHAALLWLRSPVGRAVLDNFPVPGDPVAAVHPADRRGRILAVAAVIASWFARLRARHAFVALTVDDDNPAGPWNVTVRTHRGYIGIRRGYDAPTPVEALAKALAEKAG